MSNCRFYVDVMALHKEVTGSCLLNIIKFPDGTTKRIVVDCGLFQEEEYLENNQRLPFNVNEVDSVIVTHNHVDHIGRLPLLVKNGYKGDIHVSNSTAKLIGKALGDSYKVLKNKARMANKPLLYTDSDVDETLKYIKPHDFEETVVIDENIKFTFFMNGHLPGAVVVLLQIKYHDHSDRHYDDINLLFTGDYNNKNMFFDVKPIPKWVHQLPITIIQESTYGDMDSSEVEYVFQDNVVNALNDGKEVVVPVFSLGRAQEILYTIKTWQNDGIISPRVPIYLDGKLAMSYTNIFINDGLDNKENCKDLLPENFDYVADHDMRKLIMNDGQSKIVLVTSGMGSYGPAQTYIPAYIKRKNALIHFTGYCAEGTLGRRLYDCLNGEKIEISGVLVKKQADVQFTSQFSAHAKADELINFLKPFENIKLVLINHGEASTEEIYANRVIDEIDTNDVGILGAYFFRVDSYGLVKSLTTKFN